MKRFTTFEGVFTPTLLSILGVIMYLRLGWVVGQVGLGSAVSIIVLANIITLFTALSMSSIVTNIRIGAGGAYSIISKSLGIEAGGAVVDAGEELALPADRLIEGDVGFRILLEGVDGDLLVDLHVSILVRSS